MVFSARHPCAAAAPVLLLAALMLGPPVVNAQPPSCYARLPAEPVTLQLRDANVQTTLRLLAQQYRINMLVTDDVTQRVTVDFFEVPVRDVLQSIIDATGLSCVEQAGVLRVSTAARLRAEQEERAKQQEERAKQQEERIRAEAEFRKRQLENQREQLEVEQLRARGPITERTIRLRYADAEEIARTLQGILGLPPQGMAPPANLPGIYQPLPPTVIPSLPTVPGVESLPIAPPGGTSPSPQILGFPAVPQSEFLARGLTVRAYKPTNTVFVRYYANDLDRIERLIRERLDVPLPQVQIAAQMVITNQSALEQLGIQWGGSVLAKPSGASGPALVGTGLASQTTSAGQVLPTVPVGGTGVAGGTANNPNFTGSSFLPIDPGTGVPIGGNLVNLPTTLLPSFAPAALGVLFGIIGKDFNINLAIEALEALNKARRLAAPKIVTVENGKAAIARGFQIPFVSQSFNAGTNVQFADALLRLEVTPNVIQEDGVTKIRMKVLVQNDEPDFSQTVLGNPTIFRRNAQSEVVILEGQRLVIGGVMSEIRSRVVRQVPVLGNIPVLGWLFKSRETNETAEDLIVIITPSVVQRTDGTVQR
jgi:type IV pilus assembly protein PilQ